MRKAETVFFAPRLERVQIDVKDLQIGMYVCELDRPWLESPFLFQGFELKSMDDIKAVRQVCRYVYIDRTKENRGTRVVTSSSTGYGKERLTPNSAPPAKIKTFEQEIERAEATHRQTRSLIKNFMDEVRLGGTVNVELAKQAVAQCVDSILQNPDAMMWMTQLKKRDEYTAQHSMNVCVLSIALGRQIGLSVGQLNEIGLCGMMHDMGKMRVPLEILNKPGKLTPQEMQIMQNHTTLGWKLLMTTRGIYEGAVDVAHSHHERLDGTGYPRQLKAEQITFYTRIVAIADMYDAITSDRVYQNGRTHLEALNIMTSLRGTHLDDTLTIRFIECLGIYPPGSIVELSSGEVAIVIEVNPKQKIKPKIIILLDENKRPRRERLVDLAKLDLDASGQMYRITRVARADEFGIDINQYYQSGLFERGLHAA